MNDDNGWISIHRKIMEWPLYFEEPFTRAQAWIDLLLLANHKPGVINVRGNLVPIKRGQIGWSNEKLSERWKWSRGRVSRYLTYLETVQQIEQQKSNIISLITVKNYEKYQRNNTPDDTPDDTTDGHQTIQQTDTNNNGNNVNNENKRAKNKSGTFVPPSLEEVTKYIELNQYRVDPNQWFNFYESKGWFVGKTKMRDWRAAVRTWAIRNKDQPATSTDPIEQFGRQLAKEMNQRYGEKGDNIALFRFRKKYGDEVLTKYMYLFPNF